MSLYVKNSLHNPILKFQFNTIGSTTDSPVGKHQREQVSQVKVKLNPVKFSKMSVVHVKMIDSNPEHLSQSKMI